MRKSSNILLISPDPDVATTFRELSRRMSADLQVAVSRGEGANKVAQNPFDLVFCQVDVFEHAAAANSMDGLAFMRTPPVIAFARNGSVSQAVRAVRAGAYDYLPEVPKSFSAFSGVVRSALRRRLNADGDGEMPFGAFLTEDYRLLDVCKAARRLADSIAPLLIEGERGTGKTLLSRMVHEHSIRSLGPFVEVNCGALEPGVLARSLLGYDPAEASAEGLRKGKCVEAEGGTLVLAEVGETVPSRVARVLHELALTEEPAPGKRRGKVSARLILTNTSPLAEKTVRVLFQDGVQTGITPVKLWLPPLRERSMDVPLLAHHFLEHFCVEHGRTVRTIAPGALRALVRYRWPGNVTELRTVVERSLLMNRRGEIARRDLPRRIRTASGEWGSGNGFMPLKAALREPERNYILRALEQTGWNKQQAAEKLGVSRSTLYKKLDEYGIRFERDSKGNNGSNGRQCVSVLDIPLSQ